MGVAMPERFTFYLDWIVNGQFAGLCWALEKGLYQRQGLNVSLVPWVDDGRSIIEKVLDGGLCAGSSEDNLIVAAQARGVNVKAIAAMLQETPLALMTRAEGPIRRLSDLKGRRVAMHADGIRILEAVLALQGIDQTAIEIHEVTCDLNNLIEERFDAVQGYAVSEPFALETRGVKIRLIPLRHPLLHPYAQVFFATGTNLDSHGELYRRFLSASFEGWKKALTHWDEAVAVVTNTAAQPIDANAECRTIEAMHHHAAGTVGLERFGELDLSRWTNNISSYARFGIIDREIDAAESIDSRFLSMIYPSGAVTIS